MNYLTDDAYEAVDTTRVEPTTAKKRDLKDYIKTFVAGKGGKAELCNVCAACHKQFPAQFSWGELEAACAEVQDAWTARRAAKEAAKAGGTP